MDRDGRLKEESKLEVMNICHLKKIRSEHLKITPNFGQLQAYLTISASLNKLKMCLLKQTWAVAKQSDFQKDNFFFSFDTFNLLPEAARVECHSI